MRDEDKVLILFGVVVAMVVVGTVVSDTQRRECVAAILAGTTPDAAKIDAAKKACE